MIIAQTTEPPIVKNTVDGDPQKVLQWQNPAADEQIETYLSSCNFNVDQNQNTRDVSAIRFKSIKNRKMQMKRHNHSCHSRQRIQMLSWKLARGSSRVK